LSVETFNVETVLIHIHNSEQNLLFELISTYIINYLATRANISVLSPCQEGMDERTETIYHSIT